MKQLLIERTSHIEVPTVSLHESLDKNNGRLIIRNVLLQRADTPNKNKRVYPKRVLERELNNYFNLIKSKQAYGELDHPMGEDGNVVSGQNVCQAVIDARWKGNEIFGDIEIFEQGHGAKVREWLLKGYRVGQSSRGLGSVEPLREGDDDVVEVQDDFEFIALCDVVTNPSTHNASMFIKENEFISENTINFNPKMSKIDSLIRDIICDLGGNCCIK